jgi:hypothetical protein
VKLRLTFSAHIDYAEVRGGGGDDGVENVLQKRKVTVHLFYAS